MPDDELPCLCIANGMAPAAHERGERCPGWDLLLFGNAYGTRNADGTITWLDPEDIIIKRSDMPEIAKRDTLLKQLIRHMLGPGVCVLGVPFAIGVSFIVYHRLNQGDFWISYGSWYIVLFLAFWLGRTYRWAGGK